jgi:glycosyltransferase involved in cell wall biosynthesis
MKSKKYFLINSLEWWGAERVVIHFANAAVKQWQQAYIITLKDAKFYNIPTSINHIALSHVRSNFLMFLLIPLYVYRFKKTQEQYQLSDGISFLEIANFVHILSKENASISFRTHINFFTGIIGFVYKILIKRLYPKAGKIVVNSMENKEDLAEYLRIPTNKIELVYNPIDTQQIVWEAKAPIEASLLQKIQWKKIFITTGRLIASKHHEKILQALAHIGLQDKWIYLIIGDGPQQKFLQHITEKYGLKNNIVFLWSQKNVFKYLQRADCFLYASAVEWFPNVLAEAREMNIPIITTDFKSGAREIISGRYIKEQISYPYRGTYGIIIDPQNIVTQLQILLVNFLKNS